MKLLGANLIIMLAAVAMLFGPIKFEPTRFVDAIVVVAALAAGSLVNIVLVRLALRPINSLTQVAWLVSQGLLGARVPASIMADRELTQLSRTVNQLLDDIVAQRDKIDSMSKMRVIR
jgi:nitrogen fixation/metabolism regulation signal transduction histidine kinase